MKTPLDEFCEKMEELAGRVGKSGAPGRGEFPDPEFRRNLRALAGALFARMNLVSREEFDAQSAALARAMERMEALEKQIRELQNPDSHPSHPSGNSGPGGSGPGGSGPGGSGPGGSGSGE